MNEVRVLNSVLNATRALRCLAEANGPTRLGDLSAQLGMNKSSVHLLLTTLARAGFVEQVGHGTYLLGLGTFEIGAAALNQLGIGVRLAPVLEDLAEKTDEAVSLAVIHDGEAIIVQRYESEQPLRASIRIGTRMPIDRSASGRVLLAELDEVALRRLVPTPSPDLLKRLEQAKIQRYEIQQDEWNTGISSVATVVHDANGRAVAALSISTPTTRFAPDNWVDHLLRTAQRLEEVLRTIPQPISSLGLRP